MERQVPFSYLRLGDGELWLLLRWQEGKEPKLFQKAVGGALEARTWLRREDYPRLHGAFERCSYLDTFQRVPYSANNFHRLHLNRGPKGTASPHPSLSQIFYEWVFFELPRYVAQHNCVIAGPEGPLLRELMVDPRYNRAIGDFWPPAAKVVCTGIFDNGRNYWDKIPQIKNDLIQILEKSKADTLFLSLATGAKILCLEISEMIGIRCFDFGSMLRGLTYSATPGNSLSRSSHNPFFFRIPLDVYLDALERAHPDLSVHDKVIKAHAQLKFDLIRKEVMNSYTHELIDSNNIVRNTENLHNFRFAKRHYLNRFAPFLHQPAGMQMAIQFDLWCLEQGLGVRGFFWLAWRATRHLGGNIYRGLRNHLFNGWWHFE